MTGVQTCALPICFPVTIRAVVEALKTMLPEAWDRLQIAAMVAIDNMVKEEARK